MTVPTASNRELVSKFKDKFIREAKMIAGFKHQHIVRVFDVFEENGTAYYVMEYLDGSSLQNLVRRRGRLKEADALKYIEEVGDALSYIHTKSTLHLDVKPGNIMLDTDGNAVLIDFGISKHVDSEGHLTSLSTPIGISRGYAPLEQVAQQSSDKYSPATDIYSLGATMYFLLTGKQPYDPSSILKGLPTDELDEAGVSLKTINAISCAMKADMVDRPQSVGEFLALLVAPSVSVQPGVSANKEPENDGNNEDSEETVLPETGSKVKADARDKSQDKVRGKSQDDAKDNGKDRGQAQDEETKFHKEDGTAVSGEQAEKQNPGESNGSKSKRFPKWLLGVLAGIVVAGVLAFVLNNRTGKGKYIVSGTHAGHEWVDLCLSVKWATCNVGASSPEGYGSYFAWGETSPKSDYFWANLKYCTEDDSYENVKFSKYVVSSINGPVDGKTTLELSDDAAHVNWGGSWRMPTEAEFQELIDKCTWTWTTLNGKNGYKVTSKKNGNSIFLPAAGWRLDSSLCLAGSFGNYWSSSLNESGSYDARFLYFVSGYHVTSYDNRRSGRSVRPVFR